VDKKENRENGNYKAPGRSLGKAYLVSPWLVEDTLTQMYIKNAGGRGRYAFITQVVLPILMHIVYHHRVN
jgi:hypothetical protein